MLWLRIHPVLAEKATHNISNKSINEMIFFEKDKKNIFTNSKEMNS